MRVRGLIDTGADSTALPLGYAALFGLSVPDLERGESQQVQGSIVTWHTQAPIRATLPGVGLTFELRPIFVEGALNVLWGRLDFLTGWDLILSDAETRFAIIWRGSMGENSH
jgi:hypothetical protein